MSDPQGARLAHRSSLSDVVLYCAPEKLRPLVTV
jgi:hypothetical protein